MKTIRFPVSVGPRYFIRVHPSTVGESGVVTVTRTIAPRIIPTGFEVSDLYETPGTMPVTLAAGPPNATATFTVDDDPTVLGTLDLDGSGNGGGSVPVPELPVGTHTLRMTLSTLGALYAGAETFEVMSDPVPIPVGPGNDGPIFDPGPAYDATTAWYLYDPSGQAGGYLFAINPSRQTSPHAERVLTPEHSTGVDGQPLVFEGGILGVSWDLEGDCLDADMRANLERFLGLNRRLTMVDHLKRHWDVLLESIDWTPKVMREPNYMGYKMHLVILGGPFYRTRVVQR